MYNDYYLNSIDSKLDNLDSIIINQQNIINNQQTIITNQQTSINGINALYFSFCIGITLLFAILFYHFYLDSFNRYN